MMEFINVEEDGLQVLNTRIQEAQTRWDREGETDRLTNRSCRRGRTPSAEHAHSGSAEQVRGNDGVHQHMEEDGLQVLNTRIQEPQNRWERERVTERLTNRSCR